jgi:hypothetical protein
LELTIAKPQGVKKLQTNDNNNNFDEDNNNNNLFNDNNAIDPQKSFLFMRQGVNFTNILRAPFSYESFT